MRQGKGEKAVASKRIAFFAGITASRVFGAGKGGKEVVGASYWAPVYCI